jgi:P27 family predicted phage terminase small subunit
VKGRKPKPIAEHVKAGTYRRDRHDRRTPSADGRAPRMPSGLSPAMRAAWRRVVGALEAQGTLDSADAAMVEAAAALWARAREARALVAKEGLICRGDRGWVQHPAVRIERESLTALRLVCEQLGLSPVARARLGLGDRRDADPLTELVGPSPRLIAIEGGRGRRAQSSKG